MVVCVGWKPVVISGTRGCGTGSIVSGTTMLAREPRIIFSAPALRGSVSLRKRAEEISLTLDDKHASSGGGM